ncbi:hypothetical protein F383_36741 [Gossypium arboreum]|uniref:Uncharacterized protein n=1 Tax=Gossypium arboreum TaxID=29729 RepID=A0A0B0M9V9_GOSAR|nr:hypothetical protein F383_36741 [Gossypium arboreum]
MSSTTTTLIGNCMPLVVAHIPPLVAKATGSLLHMTP